MKKGRLALLMLAFMLAVPACSNQGSSSTEPPVDPGQQTEVTLSLDKSEAQLVVAETLQLNATSTGVENPKYEWKSSDQEVVTVADGLVTAIGVGEATITVKLSGTDKKAACVITVTEAKEEGDYLIKVPTEIQVKTTFNDTYGQILQDAAAELMAKEPKLTITYDKYGGSYTQLKDVIVDGVPAGNYPDVTVAYPDSVAEFINANVHLNMEPYMYNEEYGWTQEELDDFFPAYLDEGRNYSVSGTYSLPIAKSTEAMYYDAEKLIGIVLPGINGGDAITEKYLNSLTWEELFDRLCPALMTYRDSLETEDAKKHFLDTTTVDDWAIVGYDSDDNLFITLAEQYGYGYTSINETTGTGQIDFDNDGMKGLMKKFNEAYLNHYFTTKGIIGTNVNYRSNEDQMLFSIGSTGGVNYQFSSSNAKNMKVASIPHAEGKAQKTIQQGPSIAFLNHNDPNRALAAWLFYKELTTVQRCTAWSTTTGYAPIRASVAESDDFLDYSDESQFQEKTLDHLKALNAQYVVRVSDTFFSSPVFKGSAEARTQVGGLATKAIGNTTPITDTLLDSLFKEAYDNTILKM